MELEEWEVQILIFIATSANAWTLKNKKLLILFSIDTFNVHAIVTRTTDKISYDNTAMLSYRYDGLKHTRCILCYFIIKTRSSDSPSNNAWFMRELSKDTYFIRRELMTLRKKNISMDKETSLTKDVAYFINHRFLF